jgi:hypothetical protein
MADSKVIPGSAKASTRSDENPPVSEDEALYVPVVNSNFTAHDAGVPQGYVPSHPVDDPTLSRIKDALETTGLESGLDVEGPGPEFNPDDPLHPNLEVAEEGQTVDPGKDGDHTNPDLTSGGNRSTDRGESDTNETSDAREDDAPTGKSGKSSVKW